MLIVINYNRVKMYIYKESGNLHVRNKEGVHQPLLYKAYDGGQNPVCLRDYMNIREITLIDAVKELDELGCVLTDHYFEIGFFSESTVYDFVNMLEKTAVVA